ncbi:MAG: hypothetical protein U5L06_15005 [Rhodovibrio sp.]|nr:hypothetical protein [Rhodovibrio sp.]
MLNDIAKRGGMPLVVKGAPFPGAQDRFARIAADRFTNARFGPDFPVYPQDQVPEGAQGEGNPWKTVLIVNPSSPVGGSDSCTASVTGQAVDDGKVKLVAALCRGDKAVTSLRAWGSGMSTVDSARLKQLLGDVAINLYPLRDADQDGPDIDLPI